MAFIKKKAREYGQLCLLFLGFLTGIGLVVTCGGGGGSGQQLPTSTSGTISFSPLNVDGAGTLTTVNGGTVDVNVPPALRGITNVQDALNRLNVILSPVLARATDELTPLSSRVADANLPAFLKDSATGEPLTFSRALRGLVRASSLSGVVRADDAFLLTCQEVGIGGATAQTVPYVQRSFCRDINPTTGVGVIEIFDQASLAAMPLITEYDDNYPDINTRLRIDGGDPVTGAPKITIFDGNVGAESITITLDGANGDISTVGGGFFGPGAVAPVMINAGSSGNVDAVGSAMFDGRGEFGTGGTIPVIINAGNSGNVAATGAITGDLVTGTTSVSGGTVSSLSNVMAAGTVSANVNVTAGVDVMAAGNVSGTDINATNNVTATNDVNATQDVNATNDLTVGNNATFGMAPTAVVINGVTGSISAAGSAVVNGTGTFGAMGNQVVVNGAADIGGITTDGNATIGGDVTAANLNSNASITSAGNVEAGATTGPGSGSILLNGALGDITLGNDLTAANTITATAGNLTATAGSVNAPLGNVLAGADPSAGNVGIELNGTTGTMTVNSATVGARVIGNGAMGAPNVFDVFDQSISATPTHRLVSAGEKGGAAPDGTGLPFGPRQCSDGADHS